jgi:hypothetical protein
MVASEQPVRRSIDDVVFARMQAGKLEATAHCYRVAAFPAAFAQTDDVIIVDECGCSYLLSDTGDEPLALDPRDVDSLGMFYEPSQSLSWHTLEDLRRIIYGRRSNTTA